MYDVAAKLWPHEKRLQMAFSCGNMQNPGVFDVASVLVTHSSRNYYRLLLTNWKGKGNSIKPRLHRANWQSQGTRDFWELLSSRVEHMLG